MRILGFVCLILFFVSQPLLADTIHFPGDAATLQEAIGLAGNGGTVVVAPGEYHLYGTPLYLAGNVALVSESGNPADTIIRGGARNAIWFTLNTNDRVSGFTFTDCHESAIRISHASPRIENCHFKNNTFSDGGAIHIIGGTPEIEGCVFTQNQGFHSGGAIAMGGASPIISNCLFEGNSAPYGGAIDVESGSHPTLQGCELRNNAATVYGGALFVWVNNGSSSLMAGQTVIMNNEAPFASDGYVDAGCQVTLLNCEVSPDYTDTFDGPGNITVDGAVATEALEWGKIKTLYR